ncbi:MAG TPA: hypothetical protein VLE27_17810 [Thermoanaerobaculia bacterium]|nr:hypothetical protein [Thermoanaerobaculia bacterium]
MRRGLPLGMGLLVLGLLTGSGTARAQGEPEPRVAFEETAVVASGLTPGKPVAWLGVERIVDADLAAEVVRRSTTRTAGSDGVSRLELGRSAAQRSVWVAVDVESGRFVVAAPDGYQINRRPRPALLDVAEGSGRSDAILDGDSYLFGLVVRPQEGAWTFQGGDGGPQDDDGGTDGRVRFALNQLEPLAGSPAAPDKVRGSDLWFVVDLLTMRISIHKGGVAQ